MLPPELNFEVQNSFTVAKKTEMSWLDYTRVDRTYANLMQLLAFNFVEGLIADDFRCLGPVPCITNRFRPGMSDEINAEVLDDFPFENMKRIVLSR